MKGSKLIVECFSEHFSSVFIDDNSKNLVPETTQRDIFLDDLTFDARDVLEEFYQIKSVANSFDQITPSLIKASASYVMDSIFA